MTNAPPLRPADPADVADALAYALRYDGNRRVHHADEVMARITAEHLIRHLAQAGFVLMRTEPPRRRRHRMRRPWAWHRAAIDWLSMAPCPAIAALRSFYLVGLDLTRISHTPFKSCAAACNWRVGSC